MIRRAKCIRESCNGLVYLLYWVNRCPVCKLSQWAVELPR